jgi:hypothetical protein
MVRRCVHRSADDVLLVVSDGGPEVVLTIRLVAGGNASGDNSDDVCAERIRSKQGLGGGEELSRTDVKINAHPSDYLAHGINTEVEWAGRCTAAMRRRPDILFTVALLPGLNQPVDTKVSGAGEGLRKGT